MAKESFPDTCIFPDILDCVANPPKKKNWAPGDLEPQPSLSSVLWGEEPEEAGHDVRQPLSESSSGSEADYRGSAQTVFSMGWNSLLDLKKATFWKEGVNSAPEKKKRKYNNTERAAMASYSRQSSAGHFKENGVDPGRLQKLFKLPSCQCANVECFKQFKNSKDLPSFLRTFWNMQKSDQDSMVQLCLATTSESRDKQFTLLDRPVGFKCLAALLGVGTGRLRKGTTSTPDLRHGTRPYMSRPSTWSVDGFLRIAYDSVAETMPDEFIRRGRASQKKKSDLDSDGDSGSEEVASDVENVEEMREWLSTTSAKSTLLPNQVLVRKFLPPGNVMELFEEYKATQQMLGGKPVSYTTFNHVYKERWQDILRFRSQSLFTSCEVCCAFKTQLQDKKLTFEQKLGCLQGYRAHLHDQYCDRTTIWTLQFEGADQHSGILMICTDGLDQAKFALPRDPQLRANAGLAKHQRPRLKVHGVWCYGYTLNISILDDCSRHDSSAIIEMISQAVEDVSWLCQGVFVFNKTSTYQADNTVREAKNQYLLTYIHLAVAKHLFRSACLCHLRKSHTHCRVDQL
ncbi:unnamed protein product [Durusdinium trenchii]|uniref:DUF7869 domain-containing protein n=1 Tax=Durusdinium trenchii TaxID=1381693 RepID=A0ABP0PCQ2_9DINO